MTRVWIWTVLGGLAIAGVLIYHVVREFLAALPDDVRHSVRTTARRNIRPLGVAGVVLTWTLVFALYSISLPAPGSSSGQLVAQGAATSDTTAPHAASGTTRARSTS